MKIDIIRTVQKQFKTKRSFPRRGAGDLARDRCDWAAAEREYHAHLAQFPDDQPIWVQYGHSLKEQGRRKEAEAAYRRAVDLRPGDPDAHLQLGHVLKLLGRDEDAQDAFARSMGLTPSWAAFEELGSLDMATLTPAIAGKDVENTADTIYFEIDDLLDYLKAHHTVSGIQRVQVGIITYALSEMAEGRGQCCLVRTSRHGMGFLQLAAGDVALILGYIKQPFVTKERLLQIIDFAERRATPVTPGKSQIYMVLGAFWGYGSDPARYSALKRSGVRVGVYIYDLIPVTHPEYCERGLASDFALALADGFHAFDFVLTISEHVAGSVKEYIARNNLRSIPVEAVPLAHQIHDEPVVLSASAKADLWNGPLADLKDLPFVLVVCTIEPRKNHALLYTVWKALVAERLDPPALVFVGRFGWRVNDFRDMLVDTDFLGGRIHLLHDLSDVELELLYDACLFTAFPSVVEGWGLPVGESLAHGRPSVASKTSSVPEVGGSFVDYVDPWNVTGAIDVFKRMIFDNEYRAARTKNILDNFSPRTWNDVAKDLLTRLESFRHLSKTVAYEPPLLKAGELFFPGEMSRTKQPPVGYAQRPLRLVLTESWYGIEEFGTWMRGHHGVVRFKSDCPPGTRIVAYMELVGAPWTTDHSISLCIGRQSTRAAVATFPEPVRKADVPMRIKAGSEFVYVVSGDVEADGTVLVSLQIHGSEVLTHPALSVDEERVFLVGLRGFAYASASDMELRADLSERLLRRA